MLRVAVGRRRPRREAVGGLCEEVHVSPLAFVRVAGVVLGGERPPSSSAGSASDELVVGGGRALLVEIVLVGGLLAFPPFLGERLFERLAVNDGLLASLDVSLESDMTTRC